MKFYKFLLFIFFLVNTLISQNIDNIYINIWKGGIFHICNFIILENDSVTTESYVIFKGHEIHKNFYLNKWQKNYKISREKIISLGDSFYIGDKKFYKNLLIPDEVCGKYKNWHYKFGELSNKERLNLCRNAQYICEQNNIPINMFWIFRNTKYILMPKSEFIKVFRNKKIIEKLSKNEELKSK